ncbi:DUF3221 domain-containing protein [Evansella sp. AB-rgal1]|uniref:DUF3221 domain-containing protein n=1 Tax=Evansella sp. AB-rgal1 TaxID=3242696 RepID=UPI00359EEA10
MKKALSFCFIFSFLLTSCGQGDHLIQSEERMGEGSKITMEEENDLFGLSDHKILYGKVTKKRRNEIALKSIDDSKDFYNIIYVKVEDEKQLHSIRKGQNLAVWYDYIRESNPPQTKALKVEQLE